jgi:hypothetical protein
VGDVCIVDELTACGDAVRVDLTAPLSTVIGAVVGVGSTIIADRFRWNRDEHRGRLRTRREVYTEFLVALSVAHDNLQAVAISEDLDPDARPGRLHLVVNDSGLWRARQTLSLVAPRSILDRAEEVTEALEHVKEALTADLTIFSDAYSKTRADFWRANAELRQLMREDLGARGVLDPEVGQYRYAPPSQNAASLDGS